MTESTNGTVITNGSGTLTDFIGHTWTISGNKAYINGVLQPDSKNTNITQLKYYCHQVYATTGSGGWLVSSIFDGLEFNTFGGDPYTVYGTPTTKRTRDYWENPGGARSPYVTPIGSGATALSTTDAATVDLRHGGFINTFYNYGISKWVSRSTSDPTGNFISGAQPTLLEEGSVPQVTITPHVPAGAQTPQSSSFDEPFGVIDTNGYPGMIWDFGPLSDIAYPGNGFYQGYTYQMGTQDTFGWADGRSDRLGNEQDYGIYTYDKSIGGITDYDLDPTQNPNYPMVQHQIQFMLGDSYTKSTCAWGTIGPLAGNVWPRNDSDYQGPGAVALYTGNYPYGATVFIPITTTRPSGMTQLGQMLWWSYQHYGGFIRDTMYGNAGVTMVSTKQASDKFGSLLDNCNNSGELSNKLVPNFCILSNQHQKGQSFATNPINGPGTRLDALGPPPLTETVGVTPSAEGGYISAGSTVALIDNIGQSWTITSGNKVARNGAVDTATANISQMVWAGGGIWHQNQAGNWYWWTGTPLLGWYPPGGSSKSPYTRFAVTAVAVGPKTVPKPPPPSNSPPSIVTYPSTPPTTAVIPASAGPVSAIARVTIPGALPGQVGGMTLESVTNTAITFGWTADTTGTGVRIYNVQYKQTNVAAWSTYNGAPLVDTTSELGATGIFEVTLNGLQPGTSYDMRVRAVNNAGAGLWSNVLTSATTGTTSGTGTTWNPQSATNGYGVDAATNLTVTGPNRYVGHVFSTTAISTGRVLASVVVNAPSTDFAFGIANANLGASVELGQDTNAAGVFCSQLTKQVLYFNSNDYTGTGSQGASQQGAGLFSVGPALYDATGERVTFVATSGSTYQIAFNGTVHAGAGTNTVQALYYNGYIWRQDPTGLWYFIYNSSGTWSSGTGDPRNGVASNISANGSTISGSGTSLIDASGETVAVTGSGSGSLSITFNGVADTPADAVITQVMIYNGLVWKQHSDGSWYSKRNAAATWTGPLGDPRFTSTGIVSSGDEIVIAVDFTNPNAVQMWWTNLAMIAAVGQGAWNGQICTPFQSGGITLTGLATGPYYLAVTDDLNSSVTLHTGADVGSVAKVSMPAGGSYWDANQATAAGGPPAAVGPIAGTVSTNNLALTWAAVGGATGYRVAVRLSGSANPWFSGGWSATNSTTVRGLISATAYDVQLVAYNSAGDAPASVVATFTTTTETQSLLRLRGLNCRGSDLLATGFSGMRTDLPNANAVIVPVPVSTASQVSTDVQFDTALSTVTTWLNNAVSAGYTVYAALVLTCRNGTSANTITPGPSLAGVGTFFGNLSSAAVQVAQIAKTANCEGLIVGVELAPWAGLANNDLGPFTLAHMGQWQSLYAAVKGAWPGGIITYSASQTALGITSPNSDWAMKWDFWDAVGITLFPDIPSASTTKSQIEAFLDTMPDANNATTAATGATALWNAVDTYARQLGRKVLVTASGIVPATGNQVLPQRPVNLPPPYDYTLGTNWWQAQTDELSKHVAITDGFFALSGSISGATGTNYGTDYYGVRGYNAASAINAAYGNLNGSGNTATLSAPASVTASGIAATTFTLSWGAVMGSNVSYVVEISTDGKTWQAQPATTATSIAFTTGINPATIYYLRVHAVSGAIVGPTSSVVQVTTPAAGTTRLWTNQPGADGNIWNEPIHNGATWSSSTAAMTTALTAGTPTIATDAPVAVGSASDPLITFVSQAAAGTQRDVPNIIQCRVPVGTQSSGPYPGVNRLTIMDTTQPYKIFTVTGVLSDGSSISTSMTTLNCSNAEVDDASGWMEDQTTGNYGFDMGVGIIRTWELGAASQILHALAFTCPAQMLRAPNTASDTTTNMSDGLPSIMWPMKVTDANALTTYTGKLPPGCTIGIPQTDTAPTGWPAGAMLLYNVAKGFGLVHRGTASAGTGATLHAEPSAAGNQVLKDMQSYLPQVLSRCRVLTNQLGTTSRKGTGTRVVSPPASINLPLPTEFLTLNAMPNPVSGSGFFVDGAIVMGGTTAPVLQFVDDGGTPQNLPTGAVVSTTGYKFLHSSMTQGPHTLTVQDKATPAVKATITYSVPAPVVYTPPSQTTTPTGGGALAASLLNLLTSLQGKGSISMQYVGTGADPIFGYGAISKIQTNTTKLLGGIFGDYWAPGATSYTADTTFNTYAKQHAAAKGVVGIMLTMPNPSTGKAFSDTSSLDATGLTTSGTTANTNFNKMLDSVAAGLLDLQNASIPVILRPLIRNNDVSGWTGTKTLTDAQAVTVYNYIHDRIVNSSGVKNVVWLDDFNAGFTSLPMANRVPDSTRVDILGLNLYTSSPSSDVADYTTLVNQKRLVALSEFGSNTNSAPTVSNSVTDGSGNVYTLVNGQVSINGTIDNSTHGCVGLMYYSGTVYQLASTKYWYGQTSPTPGAWGSPGGVLAPPIAGMATGYFYCKNGLMYDPTGAPWYAGGANIIDGGYGYVFDQTKQDGTPILAKFPNTRIIRLPVTGGYAYNGAYDPIVSIATKLKIVVVIENHMDRDGNGNVVSTSGGSQGSIFTGQALTDEQNWYANLATYYKNNPYVWFGTKNEPPEGINGSWQPDRLTVWQKATYDTIRATGNCCPVLVEAMLNRNWNQNPSSTNQQMTASTYKQMTNCLWDFHIYNWIYVDANGNELNDYNLQSQDITTCCHQLRDNWPFADGPAGVVAGEFGPAISGTNIDPGNTMCRCVEDLTGIGKPLIANMAWNYFKFDATDYLTDWDSGGGGTGAVNTTYSINFQNWIKGATLPANTTTALNASTSGDANFQEPTLINALKANLPNFVFFNHWWDSNGGKTGWGLASTYNVANNDWSYVKSALTNTWVKNVGDFTLTSVGPGPSTAPTGPSADGSSVYPGSGIALYDNAGNGWTISGTANAIAINGVVETGTQNVVQLSWVGGAMWQENSSNLWWSKKTPTDGWNPPSGTSTSPFTLSGSGPAGTRIKAPLASAVTGKWSVGTINGMYYKLLLPSGYDPNFLYPLVMMLHQNDQGIVFYQNVAGGADPLTADDQLQAQIDGVVNTVAFRQAYPAIIVAPLLDQRNDPGGGSINWGGVNSDTQQSELNNIALIKQLQKSYSVDSSSIYLTGWSMGGIGSWDYAIKYNSLTGTKDKIFKATLIFAGATYAWGFPTPNASVISGLTNFPIFAIHGNQDTNVPLAWDENMYQAYGGSSNYDGRRAPNGQMWYYEVPGYGHDVWDTYYSLSGTLPSVSGYTLSWDWLFSK